MTARLPSALRIHGTDRTGTRQSTGMSFATSPGANTTGMAKSFDYGSQATSTTRAPSHEQGGLPFGTLYDEEAAINEIATSTVRMHIIAGFLQSLTFCLRQDLETEAHELVQVGANRPPPEEHGRVHP